MAAEPPQRHRRSECNKRSKQSSLLYFKILKKPNVMHFAFSEHNNKLCHQISLIKN